MVMEQDLARELVASDDPILREEMPKLDAANPSMDPIELAHTLAQSVLKHGGLGLAAPQIGLRVSACVIKANPMIVMINPQIVGESDDESYYDEGCLSFPNMIIKIKRPNVIRVRYMQPNLEMKTERFEGLSARIIQHEVDHLEGILFQDRATDYHHEQAKKNRKKVLTTPV